VKTTGAYATPINAPEFKSNFKAERRMQQLKASVIAARSLTPAVKRV